MHRVSFLNAGSISFGFYFLNKEKKMLSPDFGDAGIKLARVWHSDKRRAKQTADILAGVV
jgi:hypothetical protein